MGLKLKNNAVSRLASNIAAGAVSLSVTPGDGALFPTLAAGDYFPATLIRASDSAIEIVRVTARSTDVFTITRAQEGTAALAFVSGDRVELRMTAGSALDIPSAAIQDAANKATLVDADEFCVADSDASNSIKNHTWANLKAALKTYFDTLYAKVGAVVSTGITMNTASLLGRTTSSTGAIEEIAVGTGLSLSAGTLSNTVSATTFASAAENAAGAIEGKAVDPLGIREAFNASGSAPVYACRAWANFNGTGTVAIRASGNVTSITDNGVGDYTVNFTTALPDANYAAVGMGQATSVQYPAMIGEHGSTEGTATLKTTSQIRLSVAGIISGTAAARDNNVNVCIFR